MPPLAPTPGAHRHLLRYLALGLALRLLLSLLSFGSDDAYYWSEYGKYIASHNFTAVYNDIPFYNHPPLMTAYTGALYRLSESSGLTFVFLFRLAPILADAVTTVALVRFTRKSWTALAFALDPTAIIVSGFHTNTDSVYTCLTLLAVFALSHRRDALAGTLLGAAINIKLVPILILLPLAATLPLRRLLRLFLGGLPWTLPFLLATLAMPGVFVHRVFDYSGFPNFWGTGYLLSLATRSHYHTSYNFQPFVRPYTTVAARAITLLVLAVGILWRIRRTPALEQTATADVTPHPLSPIALTATCAALFFALTPNFASQYAVFLSPFLLATGNKKALAWTATAGLFSTLLYALHWTHTFPLATTNTGFFLSDFYGLLSLPPWLAASYFALTGLRNALTKPPAAPTPLAAP